MKKDAIAIIPARGGSKRIPEKNIRPFFQKPMIQYSIEAALESGVFDAVYVSTDSEKIAEIARSCGAKVPALRPPELSHDHALTVPVLTHAIRELIPEGEKYQYGCNILATAPFLRPDALREGFELMKESKVNSGLSVTTFPFPIFRAMKLNEKGQIRWVWPEYESTRSNDLPETYHDAAQFAWFNVANFLKTGRVLADDTLPVKIPRKYVQDIDTLEDWETAEALYAAMHLEKK